MSSEAATAGQAETGKGRKKLIVIIAAAVGLLAVAGGGAFFLMGMGGSAAPADPLASETGEAPVRTPYFHQLDTITVNLNTGGGQTEFLQAQIALEVSDPAMIEIITPRMPRVIDSFQVYLREMRRADLEGSAGIYRLREELLRRVNIAVYPAVVDDILFQSLLVQ